MLEARGVSLLINSAASDGTVVDYITASDDPSGTDFKVAVGSEIVYGVVETQYLN